MSGESSGEEELHDDSQQHTRVKIQVENSVPSHNPIVVSFPGGLPQSVGDSSINDHGKRPRFLYQKLHERAASGRRIVGEDNYCTYSATFDKSTGDDRRTKLCVGVYDKKRGVVIIRESSQNGTVFALKQQVPEYLASDSEDSEDSIDSDDDDDDSNVMDHKNLEYNQVFEDFGTSKKRKVLKSQSANQVDLDNVVGSGDKSAVMAQVSKGQAMSESNRMAIEARNNVVEGGMPVKTAVDASYEKLRLQFLPKYDEMTDVPHKVYTPEAMVGKNVWNRALKDAWQCIKAEDPAKAILSQHGYYWKDNDEGWLPCAMEVVMKAPTNAHDTVERYASAILLNNILRFYLDWYKRRSIPTPKKSMKLFFGIPIDIAMECVKSFTTPFIGTDGKSSQAMSKTDRDKCVLHALLLYMRAQGQSMTISDLTPIANDLTLGVKDCGIFLRLAGCSVLKKGDKIAAALKTPLKFPPPARRGGNQARGRR